MAGIRNKARPRAKRDLSAMSRNADAAAALLKSLANGQRLRVLCALAAGELSVGEINRRVELSQSALSQHLARLRAEGIVDTRRQSQVIYYSLRSGPAENIIAALRDAFCG